MQRPKEPLSIVKGVDYYMEGAKLVFTAAYHLKRGFCCNSKCRHCPYREASTPERLVIEGLPPKRPL